MLSGSVAGSKACLRAVVPGLQNGVQSRCEQVDLAVSFPVFHAPQGQGRDKCRPARDECPGAEQEVTQVVEVLGGDRSLSRRSRSSWLMMSRSWAGSGGLEVVTSAAY